MKESLLAFVAVMVLYTPLWVIIFKQKRGTNMEKVVIFARKAGSGAAITINGKRSEVLEMLAAINAAVATTMLAAGASPEQVTGKLRELAEIGADYAFDARKAGK